MATKSSTPSSKNVKPIPDGYTSVTPYIIVNGAPAAIDYYKKAFGAEERMRHIGPGGKVMHAELSFGNAVVMLADEFPEMGHKSPMTLGGTSTGFCLYVNDVDSVFNRAVQTGGKVERPLANQFYGDRSGTLVDPFGHKWTVSTHIEDVSPEELKKRMTEMMNKPGGACA